jgi:hypothetical protein
MESCPHCNYMGGYYVKEKVSGSIYYYYNFDGSQADNSSMYDHLIHKGGKVAYCKNCDKRLFRMET